MIIIANQCEDIIACANSWVGYIEKKKGIYTEAQLKDKTYAAGHDNYTIFGKWFGLQGQPYCAMGLSYCANEAKIPTSIFPKFADCDEGMNWFKNKKRWYKTPKRGDVIFMGVPGDAQHVEIVTKVDSNKVYTIGFNTSSGSTMVPNGGTVAEKSYPLTYKNILGYGRPAYIEEDDMTKEEVIQIIDEYFAKRESSPESDWSVKEGSFAKMSKINKKTGVAPMNGKSPNGFVSREQLAAVLSRLGL